MAYTGLGIKTMKILVSVLIAGAVTLGTLRASAGVILEDLSFRLESSNTQLLPHNFFAEFDDTVYVDSTITVKGGAITKAEYSIINPPPAEPFVTAIDPVASSLEIMFNIADDTPTFIGATSDSFTILNTIGNMIGTCTLVSTNSGSICQPANAGPAEQRSMAKAILNFRNVGDKAAVPVPGGPALLALGISLMLVGRRIR